LFESSVYTYNDTRKQDRAINSLKLRGRLVQVGVCPKLELDTFEHLIKKEIEITGSRNFNNNELDEVIEFVMKIYQ
jgi:D-arabinose 1-dehydrogenase-like Zn-dependent alcohol dehydrogenase